MSETMTPIPVPAAMSAPAPVAQAGPGGTMQILLPPPLQDVMQQFPAVLTRLTALENKLTHTSSTKLVAAVAFLSGFGLCALATFLWHYGAVLFRL